MFESLFEAARDGDTQFTVYRRDEATDLEAQFATHRVRIDHRSLPPGGPDPFLVVEEDGEFAGAVGLDRLDLLLEPPVDPPGERADVSEGYRVLFDVLDETVFSAMARRQLLAVSREIEDRAFRVATGTLRVGFQTLSTFESQAGVYRQLAAPTDLDVHVYGLADWSPPEIPGVTYHGVDDADVARHWTLAFDGGGDDRQACALVARERAEGYDGVWTYDPALVRDALADLRGVD